MGVVFLEKFNPNHKPGGTPEGGQFDYSHGAGPGRYVEADPDLGHEAHISQLQDRHFVAERELTDAEKATVSGYTGNGYSNINRYLHGYRFGEPGTGPVQSDFFDGEVFNLDSAIATERTKDAITVWRGMKLPAEWTEQPDDFGAFPYAKRLPVGTRFTDKAFSSTSLDHATAAAMAVLRSPPLLLEIEVPKGAHALYLHPGRVASFFEHEVLLPRNATIELTSPLEEYGHVDPHSKKRAYVAKARLIPNAEAGKAVGSPVAKSADVVQLDKFIVDLADLIMSLPGKQKFNPNHRPAGDEHGGEFAESPGGSGAEKPKAKRPLRSKELYPEMYPSPDKTLPEFDFYNPPDTFEGVQISTEELGPGVPAVTKVGRDGTSIIINSDPDIMAAHFLSTKNPDAARWNSTNEIVHPIIHEIGHVRTAQAIGYDRMGALEGTERDWYTSLKVSDYATTSPQEFIAETYAGMRFGKTYSPAVMRLYDKLLMQGAPKVSKGLRSGPTKAVVDTLYVMRPLLNSGDLIAWAKAQGFEKTLPPEDMHVTVAYSRKPVDWSAAGDSFDHLRSTGGGREVAPLGDEGAVVLKFDLGELSDRWQQFIDEGASWDYPGYQPHVTITYDGTGIDLSNVAPYAGPLDFGPEEFSPLDEDWKSKVVEKYSPDQPRDPAGTDTGGQWTDWEGHGPDAAAAEMMANAGQPGGIDFKKIAQEAVDEVKKEHPRYKDKTTAINGLNEAMRDASGYTEWRDWYERHQALAAHLYGPVNEKIFEQFLAAGSINQGVKPNVAESILAMNHYLTGGRFDDGSFVTRIDYDGDALTALGSRLNQYQEIADGQYAHGNKVGPFQEALNGKEATAIDRHMREIIFRNPGNGSTTKSQALIGDRVIKSMAHKMGWRSEQLQAVLWSAHLGGEGKGYSLTDYREQLLTHEAEIRAFVGSHLDVKKAVFEDWPLIGDVQASFKMQADAYLGAAQLITLIDLIHKKLGTTNPNPQDVADLLGFDIELPDTEEEKAVRYNPNHRPAGDEHGGEFAPADASGVIHITLKPKLDEGDNSDDPEHISSGKWTGVDGLGANFPANPLNEAEVLIGDVTGKGPLGALDIYDVNQSEWHISYVRAITPGGGRAAMEEATRLADRHGKVLTLVVEPGASFAHGGSKLPKAKLTAWYEGFGFKNARDGSMRRDPQKAMPLPGDDEDEWMPSGPPEAGELEEIIAALGKKAVRYNPHHKPAGSSQGGQFDFSHGGGAEAALAAIMTDDQLREDMIKAKAGDTEAQKRLDEDEKRRNEYNSQRYAERRAMEDRMQLKVSAEPLPNSQAKGDKFVRFGDLPEDGISRVGNSPNVFGPAPGTAEAGVSVFEATYDKANNRWEVGQNLADSGIASFDELVSAQNEYIDEFVSGGHIDTRAPDFKHVGWMPPVYRRVAVPKEDIRPIYLVSGKVEDSGTDGEPVLSNVKILNRLHVQNIAMEGYFDPKEDLTPWDNPSAFEPKGTVKYSPDQPRVPAGSPDGGQWTDGSAGAAPEYGENELLNPEPSPGEQPFDYKHPPAEYEGVSVRIGDTPEKTWMAAYHMYGDGKDEIVINAEFLKDGNAGLNQRVGMAHASGWLSSNHPNHVIWHEMGHADLNRTRGYIQTKAAYAVSEFHPKFPEFGEVASRVSGQATVNGSEFLAEYYAARRSGKVYDSEVNGLAKKIMGFTADEQADFLDRQRRYNEEHKL